MKYQEQFRRLTRSGEAAMETGRAYRTLLDAILSTPIPDRGTIARDVYIQETIRLEGLVDEMFRSAQEDYLEAAMLGSIGL